MISTEIWKDIEGYEGLYQVSNKGRIRALNFKRTGECRVLKKYIRHGYHVVHLYKNGCYKTFRVHRLIAKSFIPNLENKPHINHIDGNRGNNSLDNLEWCTPRENSLHAIRTGLAKPPKPRYGKDNHKSKSVIQCDMNGSFIRRWDCIRDAEKEYKAHHISAVCKGQRKSCKGFVWKYEEVM